MENINQVAQPVNQPVAQPQQQEPQAPQAIPYDRFASVIAERNSLRDQLNQVAGQIAQAQLEQAQLQHQQEMANENYQKELDRINKKEIALIAAESKGGPLSDVDVSGVPDVLEISK